RIPDAFGASHCPCSRGVASRSGYPGAPAERRIAGRASARERGIERPRAGVRRRYRGLGPARRGICEPVAARASRVARPHAVSASGRPCGSGRHRDRHGLRRIPRDRAAPYRDDLDRAARQVEPAALRAQAAEKKIADARIKIAALDDIRRRPQADLDILNELTRLLQPPVWTSSIEIYTDSVVVSGEADQAAPLLKVLDSSPLFQNSEFALSVTRNGQTEVFRIKTMRRGRAG